MRLLRFFPLMLSLLLAFASASAQGTTPTEAAAITAAQADHTAYTLAPALLAKAQALSRIGLMLQFGGALWAILVLLLLLELGLAARMRNVAINLTKNRWGQCAIFVLETLVLLALANLPLRLYGHAIGLAYGLSVQGWLSWFGDSLKSFVLELLIAVPLVYFVFWRIRRSPRMWWLQVSGLLMAVSLAGVFVTPYVIDPLFNHFEPLARTHPELVARMEQVARRDTGQPIPPERMFLMRASDKVTVPNAYVTGFGSSKRVVLWDTMIAKEKTDEILFDFGHEMGHYVLGHVVMGLLVSFGFILVSFFVGVYLFRWLLARFGKRWRVPAADHWGALIVLALIFQTLNFFEEPLYNAISRGFEHNADVYGQEVIHGIVADPAKTAQSSFDALGTLTFDNPEPSPLDFWTDNHPTTSFRAAFAKHYDPWTAGNAPKYFKR